MASASSLQALLTSVSSVVIAFDHFWVLIMNVAIVAPADSALTTDVLCSAFADYPVMRYVLGSMPPYADRLRILIGLFVANRVFRGDLMLGIRNAEGTLVASALVTLPGDRPTPAALIELREKVWLQLGPEARARYEAFADAAAPFDVEVPHHHLNMIGVRPAYAGQGLGRVLLDHVYALALADEGSAGVSLSTEAQRNLSLYRHFGYREMGYAQVSPTLETWAFFRPSRAG